MKSSPRRATCMASRDSKTSSSPSWRRAETFRSFPPPEPREPRGTVARSTQGGRSIWRACHRQFFWHDLAKPRASKEQPSYLSGVLAFLGKILSLQGLTAGGHDRHSHVVLPACRSLR